MTDAELKLQYFGHLMQRADSFEKTLVVGKIEARRRRGLSEIHGEVLPPDGRGSGELRS